MINLEIENCIKVLSEGGVIIYPTDTVWGIGCLATDENAVKKIYQLKKRVESKSMILLLDDKDHLSSYLDDPIQPAFKLIEKSKKALTIIYPNAKPLIASNLIAEDGSIAIRIPKDEFCHKLIKELKAPLVSTSANYANQPTPSNFSEIDSLLLSQVDYVVKHRQSEKKKNKSSRIVKMDQLGNFEIIRP